MIKNIFIPGLQLGERLYITLETEDGKLAGCTLLKNTRDEKKISTIFIDPKYRSNGLGSKLMGKSIDILGQSPLITVSDKNLSELKPLLDKFEFLLSSIKKDIYKKGDKEYFFNEKDKIINSLAASTLTENIR